MDDLIRQIQKELVDNPILEDEWDKSSYHFKLLHSLRIARKETIIYPQLIEIYRDKESTDPIAFGIFLTIKEQEQERRGIEIIFRYIEDAENLFKTIARCIDIHLVLGGLSCEPIDEEDGKNE